jgi:hypothetical protein
MNTTIIILGVIIVILIYVLYKYFTNVTSTLQAQANLNNQIPSITSLTNATATRYAYGIWIYINTWNAQVPHTIFSRAGNVKLYLEQSAPILYCDITMSDDTRQKMTITDNFPLQKWTHIIVSVDNQYVDVYLDGKLIQSHRFYVPAVPGGAQAISPKVPPVAIVPTAIPLPNAPAASAAVPIFLGNSDTTLTGNVFRQFDAYATKFKRWDSGPVDPQSAWSAYMEGNGTNPILGALGNYGASITVLKNNIENSKLVLF